MSKKIKWISPENAMPPIGRKVIVCIGAEVFIAELECFMYEGGKGRSNQEGTKPQFRGDGHLFNKIDYWTHIPKLPQQPTTENTP